MKKKIFLALVVVALLVAVAPTALAWKEGPGTNWWYIDAVYEGYHSSGTLAIELNGNPAGGQTFVVGDTISITGDLHAYAAMCAGTGNEAYTDAELAVTGPSGADSDTAGDYDFNDYECAEVDTIDTLTITYPLTAVGTHTVYMYSYAEAASWWTGVDVDDFADDLLTFEVVPIEVDIDIKPLSDPNSINTKSKGVIPVAILTTATFDATGVDGETVTFSGANPAHDLSDPLVVADHQHDVDLDGDIDYVFHFRVSETGIGVGDIEACLEGETLGGLPIEGCDAVRVVK